MSSRYFVSVGWRLVVLVGINAVAVGVGISGGWAWGIVIACVSLVFALTEREALYDLYTERSWQAGKVPLQYLRYLNTLPLGRYRGSVRRLRESEMFQSLSAEAQTKILRALLESEAGARKRGWREITFRSLYYGASPGEEEKKMVFLFHPDTKVSQWEGAVFQHGDSGWDEKREEFEKFLDPLEAGVDYIEIR